jgi:hypothetical protein
MTHVQSGHQRRTRGGANRGAGVGLIVTHSLRGHAVESRSLDQLLSITSEIALREVVTEECGWPTAELIAERIKEKRRVEPVATRKERTL